MITGDSDTVVPVQNSRNVGARVPNATLEAGKISDTIVMCASGGLNMDCVAMKY